MASPTKRLPPERPSSPEEVSWDPSTDPAVELITTGPYQPLRRRSSQDVDDRENNNISSHLLHQDSLGRIDSWPHDRPALHERTARFFSNSDVVTPGQPNSKISYASEMLEMDDDIIPMKPKYTLGMHVKRMARAYFRSIGKSLTLVEKGVESIQIRHDNGGNPCMCL